MRPAPRLQTCTVGKLPGVAVLRLYCSTCGHRTKRPSLCECPIETGAAPRASARNALPPTNGVPGNSFHNPSDQHPNRARVVEVGNECVSLFHSEVGK